MASYNVEMQMLNSSGSYDTIYPKSFSSSFYEMTYTGNNSNGRGLILNSNGIIPKVIFIGAYKRTQNQERNSPIQGLYDLNGSTSLDKMIVQDTTQSCILNFISVEHVQIVLYDVTPEVKRGICEMYLQIEGPNNEVVYLFIQSIKTLDTDVQNSSYCFNSSSFQYKLIYWA